MNMMRLAGGSGAVALQKFIVGYGMDSRVTIVDASTLQIAEHIAVSLCANLGVDPEMMSDCAWAAPYSEDLALELGLQPYEYAE
jgi:hypothetical protein